MRRSAAATLGRRGGKAKSEAKAQAARANGKKGGRPRKAEADPFSRETPSSPTETAKRENETP